MKIKAFSINQKGGLNDVKIYVSCARGKSPTTSN
jgi:hypothetical protein